MYTSEVTKATAEAGELAKLMTGAYAAAEAAESPEDKAKAYERGKDYALKMTEANARAGEARAKQSQHEADLKLANSIISVQTAPPAATGAPPAEVDADADYRRAYSAASGAFFRNGFVQAREAYRESSGPADRFNALFSGDAASGGLLIQETIAEYRDPGVTGTVMPGLVSMEPTDGPLLWPSSTNLAPADSDWTGEGYRMYPDGTEGSMEFDGTRIVPVSWNPPYQRVPQELLVNRGANVERIVMTQLNRLWELSKEKYITEGNGARKPLGFLSTAAGLKDDGASANKTVATGVADELTWAGILNLVFSVPEQWATNLTLVGKRYTLPTIYSIPDPAGSYIFRLAATTAPGTILGYPYAENQYMPAVAADAYPLAIGNWSAAYVWAFVPGSERVIRYEDSNIGPGNAAFAITAICNGAVVESDAIRLLKVAASVP